MSYESSSYHEAGHAVLMLLAEDVLGAPRLISALPTEDSAGRVIPSRACGDDTSPEAMRAFGRVLAGGAMAEQLAGFESRGAGGDARRLVKFARLAGREGNEFARECCDGAEFLLRLHWGGVKEIVKALGACGGTMGAPHGVGLARLMLHRRPMRQLGLTAKALLRLAPSLEKVPEIAVPLTAALAAPAEGPL